MQIYGYGTDFFTRLSGEGKIRSPSAWFAELTYRPSRESGHFLLANFSARGFIQANRTGDQREVTKLSHNGAELFKSRRKSTNN
jgi:hypothetical protein